MNCEPLANGLTDIIEAALNAPSSTAELALQELLIPSVRWLSQSFDGHYRGATTKRGHKT